MSKTENLQRLASMRPRAKGIIGVMDTKPSGALWEQAKAILAAKAQAKAERQAKRDAEPVPNWRCYPMVFIVGKNIDHNGNWLGGMLPKCRVCEDRLPPREHHVCSGFTPKYVERTEETKQRWEAKREEIRESRQRQRYATCSVCGEEIEDFEMGQWHWDSHEGLPERVGQGVDGEHDGDLDGYDDVPEEDHCEGDDDGYDCD
jgi:hypothetical protein